MTVRSRTKVRASQPRKVSAETAANSSVCPKVSGRRKVRLNETCKKMTVNNIKMPAPSRISVLRRRRISRRVFGSAGTRISPSLCAEVAVVLHGGAKDVWKGIIPNRPASQPSRVSGTQNLPGRIGNGASHLPDFGDVGELESHICQLRQMWGTSLAWPRDVGHPGCVS